MAELRILKRADAVIPPAPDLHYEAHFWRQGLLGVVGLDEAGRGAWAGPVAAGAVLLPPDPLLTQTLHGVRDSKQMSASQRQQWASQIQLAARAWAVGMADCAEIDALGIIRATRLAMHRALESLGTVLDALLLDALSLPDYAKIPQWVLIKGDQRALSIAAASVLAKTARDAWMIQLDTQYPQYGFAQHKGYGTARHTKALLEMGRCPQHRITFHIPDQQVETP